MHVLLERLPAHASDHSPGTSGVLKVGQTFHVPLHLTNRTKLHVRPAGVAANHPPTVDDASGLIAKREEKRPWFTGSNADLDDPTSNLLPEAVEWLRDSPATIVLDAAQIGRRVNNPHTTGKFEPLDRRQPTTTARTAGRGSSASTANVRWSPIRCGARCWT